jgi:cation diffusion facilitator family transporter
MRDARRGIRAAQSGAVVNILLAAIKVTAGALGNTYALLADGLESLTDVAASLIVWGGIAVASQPPDEDHPYGHGKAEALAAAAVSVMLLGAAVGIAVQAIREILTPHQFPRAWTLLVLVGVVAIKTVLARRVRSVGDASGSPAVQADASHHSSDAITSAAAFIGISVALLGRHFGGGPGWAAADDWAALAASVIVTRNGVSMLMVGLDDLMDRTPGSAVLSPLRAAALNVAGVCAVETLSARRVGFGFHVIVHIEAAATLTLAEGHEISHRVVDAMTAAVPRVLSVVVHMEPHEPVPS